MRILLAAAVLCAGATLAAAETRIFIIQSHGDYGNRCLANATPCAKVVASAYCQSREYATAASFRRVERDEVTGNTGSSLCRGAICTDWVAIECTR